jgi:hypothetical protein
LCFVCRESSCYAGRVGCPRDGVVEQGLACPPRWFGVVWVVPGRHQPVLSSCAEAAGQVQAVLGELDYLRTVHVVLH